jgi:hypothetical protein
MENVVEQEFLTQEALKEGTPSPIIGTTWRASNNAFFLAFDVTFNANGTGTAISRNGNFSGTLTWSGNESSLVFTVTWYNGSTRKYFCSANPSQGTGTVHFSGNGNHHVHPFTFTQQ